ncbi:MAG: radical SAM protein [Desulfobulbaceae bacterium]
MNVIYQPKLRLILPQHCNLRCKVCHQENNSASFTHNIPAAFHVIEELGSSCFVEHFNITGGEPFVHANRRATRLFSEFIRSRFNTAILSVNTNGLCIDSHNAQEIAHYFDYVKLTLFGSNREEYQHYSGTDAYNEAIDSLSLLLAAGADVRLNVLATKLLLNEETLVRYLMLAKKFKIPIKFIELVSHNWFSSSRKYFFDSLFVPIQLLSDKILSTGISMIGSGINRTIFDFDGVQVQVYKCPITPSSTSNIVFSHLLRSDGVQIKELDTQREFSQLVPLAQWKPSQSQLKK